MTWSAPRGILPTSEDPRALGVMRRLVFRTRYHSLGYSIVGLVREDLEPTRRGSKRAGPKPAPGALCRAPSIRAGTDRPGPGASQDECRWHRGSSAP